MHIHAHLITKAYFPESNNINYWLKIRLALKFWESLILSCPRSMSCTWKRAMAINIAVTMTYYVVRIRLATLKWVNQQSRSPWYKDGEYTKNCVFIKVYLCLAEHYLHPVCSLFLYSCLRSSTGGMVDHVKLLWTHKNQYWHVTTLNNQKSITVKYYAFPLNRPSITAVYQHWLPLLLAGCCIHIANDHIAKIMTGSIAIPRRNGPDRVVQMGRPKANVSPSRIMPKTC